MTAGLRRTPSNPARSRNWLTTNATPAGSVPPPVSADGVAGPLDGRVGVYTLAEDEVLIGARQADRQAGLPAASRRGASGPSVDRQQDMAQVGDEPDRRQRLAAGGDLQGPLEGRSYAGPVPAAPPAGTTSPEAQIGGRHPGRGFRGRSLRHSSGTYADAGPMGGRPAGQAFYPNLPRPASGHPAQPLLPLISTRPSRADRQ